jgi:hypothetical protein
MFIANKSKKQVALCFLDLSRVFFQRLLYSSSTFCG